MITLIFIGNGANSTYDVAERIKKSAATIALLKTREIQSAMVMAAEQEPTVFIIDLSAFNTSQTSQITRLTHRFPHIPCIALTTESSLPLNDEMSKVGVSATLDLETDHDELLKVIGQQVELASSGQVKNIPIHSLLQMLESDEKTCTLKVTAGTDSGYVFIDKGAVIGAETGELENEDAVYAIIGWDNTVVEILYYNRQRIRQINKPLISLIMEALRLKDEKESLRQKQESEQKPKLELKHISTAGNRMSLSIGSKIKMEFDDLDTSLASTLVGMIPDEYLIVTTPTPFAMARTALTSSSRIVVKYLHMGRLCMFKTQLLKAISDPHRLLFLEYPPVIHYHELRKAKRTAIFIPCTLHLTAGPEFYGVLIDLSGLGCLCQIKAKGNAHLPNLDINAKVQLRCLLPGLNEDQELNGLVMNIKKSSTETRFGIKFSGLQTYLKEAIEQYVYSVESITGN